MKDIQFYRYITDGHRNPFTRHQERSIFGFLEPQVAPDVKKVPLEDDLMVRKMFDYQNNRIEVRCNFDTVRNRYQSFMQELYTAELSAARPLTEV
jgi:hypothetical protein